MTAIFWKCLVRPWGENLRVPTISQLLSRVFGDVKFVSNIFHLPLALHWIVYTRCDEGEHANLCFQVSKGGARNIPKAFEIFTADKTYVLKVVIC